LEGLFLKKKNAFITSLVFILIAILFVGCSTSNNTSGSNTSSVTPDSSASSGATPASGSEKKLGTVAMTVMTLDNPYFVAYKQSLEELAAKEGFKAITEGADFDLAKQQAQIEAFIQKKVDLILVNAVDSKGIAGAVQEAVAANIPIMAVDVTADGGVQATIMSDNFQAGKLAGEYLVKRLNGKGNVVLINGNPISSIFDRVAGFKEAIKNSPDIKIIEDQNGKQNRDDSNKVFENILASHKVGTIQAVFGVNDPTAIGAYLAAKAAKRDDFFFTSVDGSKDAVDLIKSDDMFGVTSAQHPKAQVVKAIELAKDLLAGKTIEKTVLIPVDSISKETLSSFTPEF
jgi:ribose transport system substrate-binding protein